MAYTHPIQPLHDVLKEARTLADVERAYEKNIAEMQAHIAAERPDVVLLHGTYSLPWCMMRAARRARVPFLVYYHGSLTKETEHWTQSRAKRLIQMMERSFYSPSAAYVFPSRLVKHFVERHVFKHSIARKYALVLPNPVPQEFFDVRAKKQSGRVAFVGRWTQIKNTEFLERFVRINARYGKPFALHILTDARGRTEAKRILGERAVVRESISQPRDMAQFYADMGALICPSFFETYGNVAQEAIAAGTPAFVGKNTGVSEILTEIGLQKYVIDFSDYTKVFKTVRSQSTARISARARSRLAQLAHPQVVHTALLTHIHKFLSRH